MGDLTSLGGGSMGAWASVCPECDALLPPKDTERRHRHIERCEKLTRLLTTIDKERST